MKDINKVLKEVINKTRAKEEVRQRFLKRLKEGNLTREENKQSHFCVYFVAFDPVKKKILIGDHIKAGCWLVNGGHMDKGEFPRETMLREMGEEWGIKVQNLECKVKNLNSKFKIQKSKAKNNKIEKLKEQGIVEDLERLEPELLTVTEINNPKVNCRKHFDIWYMIAVDTEIFRPDEKLMEKEFYKWGWKSVEVIRKLVKNESYYDLYDEAMRLIEKRFENA